MNDPVEGHRPELPIDFIHVPKAAGATFQNIIRRVYRPRPFVWFNGTSTEEDVFRSLPEHQRHAVDFLIGHHHWGLQPLLRQPVTTIVLLREPIDRVISHYYYVKRQTNHAEHRKVVEGNLSLRDFVEQRASRMIDNDHVRWMNEPLHRDVPFGTVDRAMLDRAKERLSEDRTIVGLVERFDESVRHVAGTLGWPDVGYATANATPNRPKIDDVDPATRDMIAEVNAHDVELYRLAADLFERQLADAAPNATPNVGPNVAPNVAP